ncbi:hypothetical protein P7C73_g258, partial [Tremellales sp. Uapishka_1]
MSPFSSPVLQNSSFSELDYFNSPLLTLSLTPTSSQSSYSSPEIETDPAGDDVHVIPSPQFLTKEVARRSVQIDGKTRMNWARPIRVEEAATHEPVTPDDSDTSFSGPLPNHGWAVAVEGKGLGVSGVVAWDTPRKNSTDRILTSSQSLDCFTSPTTLNELRSLRRAAVNLMDEAKRPMKVGAPRENKIRRKAVPSVVEIEDDGYSPSHFHRISAPVLPMSPRMTSLPFVVPPRHTSQQRYSGSSSSSVSDQPITPGSSQQFVLQVNEGLKRFELAERDLELQNQGTLKHRRGLSRFLGK